MPNRTIAAFIDAATSLVGGGTGSPEGAVERALTGLPGSCNVVRDVVLPGGRVRLDHVVLTPSGIHTLAAKSHAGVVTFDGARLLLNGRPFERDHLSQARADAVALRDHLSAVSAGEAHLVAPVLVFTRASVKVQGPAKGVRIVTLRGMTTELTSGGSRISAEKREAVTGWLQQLAR